MSQGFLRRKSDCPRLRSDAGISLTEVLIAVGIMSIGGLFAMEGIDLHGRMNNEIDRLDSWTQFRGQMHASLTDADSCVKSMGSVDFRSDTWQPVIVRDKSGSRTFASGMVIDNAFRVEKLLAKPGKSSGGRYLVEVSAFAKKLRSSFSEKESPYLNESVFVSVVAKVGKVSTCSADDIVALESHVKSLLARLDTVRSQLNLMGTLCPADVGTANQAVAGFLPSGQPICKSLGWTVAEETMRWNGKKKDLHQGVCEEDEVMTYAYVNYGGDPLNAGYGDFELACAKIGAK